MSAQAPDEAADLKAYTIDLMTAVVQDDIDTVWMIMCDVESRHKVPGLFAVACGVASAVRNAVLAAAQRRGDLRPGGMSTISLGDTSDPHVRWAGEFIVAVTNETYEQAADLFYDSVQRGKTYHVSAMTHLMLVAGNAVRAALADLEPGD